MNEELPSIKDFIVDISQLPSINEEVEDELPSINDYIEKEEEVLTEEVESELASVEDSIEQEEEIIEEETDTETIVSEIESVRDSNPEVKSYDKEMYDLVRLIEEVRRDLPAEPVVTHYDEDIKELKESISEVKDRYIPDFRWIYKSFSQLDENQENLEQNITTNLSEIKSSIESDMKSLLENLEVAKSESSKNLDEIDQKLSSTLNEKIDNVGEKIDDVDQKLSLTGEKLHETKEKIYKEIRDASLRIWNLKQEFQEDDNKLKKELGIQYKKLGESISNIADSQEEKYTEINSYLEGLKEEIINLPEVKYYDEQIVEVNESVRSIRNLVGLLEHKLNKKIEGLKESILVVPPSTDNEDPLTPLDKNFATLDDLSSHYRLFLNRIQQQLASLGGGGETRLEFLDDVDRDSVKVDGKFLRYDASSGKWIGASASGASFSGTAGQFLQHNGTEFVGVGSTAVTNTIRDASQGFYGYTTDFYTVGVANTTQDLEEDEFTLVMPQVAVGGTYSYLPTRMHTCNNGNPWVGSGATIGTGQTEFSLAGTIPRSTVLVRFAYDFVPDVDDSDLDLRLHFTTNTTTQAGGLTNFDIDKQGMVCSVGAGITYGGENLISFFVGETLAGDTKAEAGRFCVQANASDGGTLEVKALNIIVDV